MKLTLRTTGSKSDSSIRYNENELDIVVSLTLIIPFDELSNLEPAVVGVSSKFFFS